MSVIDDVIALIDRDELVRFALEICNIDSAVGHEREVGEHLYNWMLREGFVARKIGLLSDRFNVLGTLPGTGGGYSLIFNSHMDTAVPRHPDLVHADPTHRVYHSAWQENDLLVGGGICNDKGPICLSTIGAQATQPNLLNQLGLLEQALGALRRSASYGPPDSWKMRPGTSRRRATPASCRASYSRSTSPCQWSRRPTSAT